MREVFLRMPRIDVHSRSNLITQPTHPTYSRNLLKNHWETQLTKPPIKSGYKPQAVTALKQLSRAAPSQEWHITVSAVPTQESFPEKGRLLKNHMEDVNSGHVRYLECGHLIDNLHLLLVWGSLFKSKL